MAQTHLPTMVDIKNTGQRGPAIFHKPTCSCGWVGQTALPDCAGHQWSEHVRISL